MRGLSRPRGAELSEGTRIGRYLVLRDVDGRRHALSAGAVHAACEEDDGETVLFLPSGRALRIDVPLAILLGWLDGRG
ncbi:MAG TPA: hypothetical protein VIL69_25070 [Roseomonas sp.]